VRKTDKYGLREGAAAVRSIDDRTASCDAQSELSTTCGVADDIPQDDHAEGHP